ncbi:hypothetical protein N7520_003549 [Penicillium odoratum]|uniref:uncharacterized protein n=1 Tax=Penicillium odoratum TaxID=1167516 RepID=UPI002548DEB9|nr:uncharacterized protein N7520_003549 [Penicillium odoratum]KAJ5768990.1 hypothetical protein N7520_003549 [Penicillium odoratum]
MNKLKNLIYIGYNDYIKMSLASNQESALNKRRARQIRYKYIAYRSSLAYQIALLECRKIRVPAFKLSRGIVIQSTRLPGGQMEAASHQGQLIGQSASGI